MTRTQFDALLELPVTHNATVTLIAFALGITLGVGTVWFMFENGLMMGVLGGRLRGSGGHTQVTAIS